MKVMNNLFYFPKGINREKYFYPGGGYIYPPLPLNFF